MSTSHTPTLLNGQPLSKKAQDFEDTLAYFHGTDEYHRHGFGSFTLFLTDGCDYVRQNGGNGGAYWLFDIILSYQFKLRRFDFQVWTLEKLDGDGWLISCSVNGMVLVKQEVDYSDFDLPKITIYLKDGICLLPSED